jgi:4-coumarate--CoA ligase
VDFNPTDLRYKITSLFAVPPMLLALLHRVPHEKLKFDPPLEIVSCAAAPLPEDLILKLEQIWPKTLIRQGWGMTETATTVTFTPKGSPPGFSHTCGIVVPNAEAVIVDPEKFKSIAPGDGRGELWARAPSVTLGYIDNEQETKSTFNIGGQGWMRSGDEAEFKRGLVKIDGEIKEAWLLCIRDRLKELIKVRVSGMKLTKRYLETKLLLQNWRAFLHPIHVLQTNVLLASLMSGEERFLGHLLSRKRKSQRGRL